MCKILFHLIHYFFEEIPTRRSGHDLNIFEILVYTTRFLVELYVMKNSTTLVGVVKSQITWHVHTQMILCAIVSKRDSLGTHRVVILKNQTILWSNGISTLYLLKKFSCFNKIISNFFVCFAGIPNN